MTCGIYCIENLVNGKKYIGKSIDIDRRLTRHKSELKTGSHKNEYLQRAYKKYGQDNFMFYVITELPKLVDVLDLMEKFYISSLETTLPNGYNCRGGGDGGHEATKETRLRMSISQTGRRWTDIQKNNLSSSKMGEKNPFYGKHHSAEAKKLIGESSKKRTGRIASEQTRRRMSKASLGKKKANASSSYYGVSITMNGKWRVIVSQNKKQINIGVFDDEKEAALAYDGYVKNHNLGLYLNFPGGT